MTKPKWQIKAEVFSSPALLLKPVWNRNVGLDVEEKKKKKTLRRKIGPDKKKQERR